MPSSWTGDTKLRSSAAPFQSKFSPLPFSPASGAAACVLPGYQAMCFVMPTAHGTQGGAPQVSQPVPHTPLRTVLARKREDNSACVQFSSTLDADLIISKNSASDAAERGLTRELVDVELPSVGSAAHFDGSCKRCAFFSKGRCQNGKDCSHCHFSHEARPRLRKGRGADVRLRAHRSAPAESAYSKQETPTAEDSQMLTFSVQQAALAEMINALPDSDSDDDMPVTEGVSKEDCGAVAIAKFNEALEEAAKADLTDAMQSTVKFQYLRQQSADVDTTASASSLAAPSDDEQFTSSSNSDSEVASVREDGQSATRMCEVDSPGASPMSWSASRKAHSFGSCTKSDIARLTRGLLNKLTAERFESLSKQILALPLSTPDHLAVVVKEVFAKATTQDCFRSLYTELCMRLDSSLAPQASVVGSKAFRRALLNECQTTFERNLQPQDTAIFAGLNDEESFEMHMKLKTQRLGNMRFIGDLLVRRLLAPKVLAPIVNQLLSGNEDALESLIALITVVAPEFDKDTSLYQAPLLDAFQVLRRKNEKESVCPRMRCQINDLFDAKARNWVSRTVCA